MAVLYTNAIFVQGIIAETISIAVYGTGCCNYGYNSTASEGKLQ